MTRRFAAILVLSAMLPCLPAMAGGSAKNKASITFHLETDASDNPKMIFPQLANGQTRYFRRMPEIGIKDMVSFTPFQAENGEGLGLVFRLKENASRRWSAITNTNQRRWMIANLNGRIVDGVVIDRQVDDGVLVVWKGATAEDLVLLDKALPRTGEEGKKKKN